MSSAIQMLIANFIDYIILMQVVYYIFQDVLFKILS